MYILYIYIRVILPEGYPVYVCVCKHRIAAIEKKISTAGRTLLLNWYGYMYVRTHTLSLSHTHTHTHTYSHIHTHTHTHGNAVHFQQPTFFHWDYFDLGLWVFFVWGFLCPVYICILFWVWRRIYSMSATRIGCGSRAFNWQRPLTFTEILLPAFVFFFFWGGGAVFVCNTQWQRIPRP